MSLTVERLREVLHYDPETGVFTWRVRTAHCVVLGSVAGANNGKGHIRIAIDGVRYHAHRLAWLYVTGDWPADQIDHANGVKGDNRFANLRQASRHENARNRGRQSNNASGFKGVHRNGTRWRASIRKHGSLRHLGYFSSPEAAHAAYVAAAERYFGEFARAE